MIDWKQLATMATRSLVYSMLVILANFIIAFLVFGDIIKHLSSISLFLLLEGGIFLVVGGTSVMYSPMGAKISELMFKSRPWNAKRQKEVEKKATTWIATGLILIISALSISAL